MKYLLTVSLFVVLITSLGVRQAHKAVPLTHQTSSSAHLTVNSGHQGVKQKHQSAEAKHQVFQALSAGLGFANSAIDLGQKIADMFPVTCSASGYKRSNQIKIYNGLSKEIRVSGNYQDSGKLYTHGSTYIASKTATSWEFVKHSGTATGSCGVVIVDLPQKTLVIFYQNPWSSWNFAGICLQNKINQWPTSDQMGEIYHRLYSSQPNWPSSCKLADNTSSKSIHFQRRLQLKAGGYNINAAVKYQYIDKSGPNDCYNQEMTVLIA